MSDWPRISLGDIFEIARGGSPRPIDAYITDADDGINWISIADASDSSKYIERTKRRIRPEGATRSRAVVPGDLLLTNSMSFGRPYIMRTTGCIHDGWLVLAKKREGIDQDFFYRLLGSETVYAAFARLAAGATVKNLNIELVKGVSVPVPPLPEQRRIAAILDQADALRAKRRDALAQLDSLTQSIFIEMFGEPVANCMKWPELTFDQTFRDETSRATKTLQADYLDAGAIPVIDQGQKTVAGYVNEEAKLCPCELPVIVFGDHTRAVKLITFPFAVGADGAKVLVPKSGVSAVYVAHLLRLLPIPNLGYSRHMKELKRLLYPVPPIALQQTFANRIQAVESFRATHRAALTELDALFASLQHRAFAGQLS